MHTRQKIEIAIIPLFRKKYYSNKNLFKLLFYSILYPHLGKSNISKPDLQSNNE